jgi:hypothetical protein
MESRPSSSARRRLCSQVDRPFRRSECANAAPRSSSRCRSTIPSSSHRVISSGGHEKVRVPSSCSSMPVIADRRRSCVPGEQAEFGRLIECHPHDSLGLIAAGGEDVRELRDHVSDSGLAVAAHPHGGSAGIESVDRLRGLAEDHGLSLEQSRLGVVDRERPCIGDEARAGHGRIVGPTPDRCSRRTVGSTPCRCECCG